MENNKDKEYEGRSQEDEMAKDKELENGSEAMAQEENLESEGIK